MLISSDTLLNILLPNNNKVLKEVLKEADFKSLEQMIKNSSTSINDVLTELFDDIKNGTKSNTTIENILKNSTIFKDLGSVTNNISTLLENISQDENLSKFKPLVENFLKNIKDMDENSLKEQIKNSGIFLESKLSSHEGSKISHDMKTILLQIQEEINSKTDTKNSELSKQVDKLLTQIDYYQLNSLATNSNYVYVPFFWDMLEDGTISMKKKDEEKFFCQINLTLKKYGKVDLMLSLYDKNKLDLTIYTQKEEFKTEIRENMQKLKIALNNASLIPVNIKLLDLKEEKETIPEQTYLDNSYSKIDFSSIDIRA